MFLVFPINSTVIKFYKYMLIEDILLLFIPFLLAIVMNVLIRFQTKIKIKVILQILMKITNFLSLIYLGIIVYLMYVGATMFD